MRLARRDGILLPGIDVLKRDYPPGLHGPKGRPRKMSQYGQQLREKQKAKHSYGILERQFSNYVQRARRRKGDSAAGLIELLERRLDNVVYRLGWSKTRQGARQLVRHGDIVVNGRRVNLPAFEVKIGQLIGLAQAITKRPPWEQIQELAKKRDLPSWLQLTDDAQLALAAKISSLPATQDAEQVFDPQAIVEFYSK